jgi:hypothetical protein
MWRLLAGFRCGRCGKVHGRWNRALWSPSRPHLAICRPCLETWERTGHRCARCWTQLHDRLDVGLLVETGVFVHVECGGARVIGSHLSGTLGGSRPARSAPRDFWLRLFQSR